MLKLAKVPSLRKIESQRVKLPNPNKPVGAQTTTAEYVVMAIHRVINCDKFNKITPEKRLDVAKERRLFQLLRLQQPYLKKV